MNRFVLFVLGGAVAQGPGNGISKSTYSCNDPIAAKKFLSKYFPVQSAPDSCANDVCTCSGWDIQQGRVYIPYSSDGRSLLSKRGDEGRRLQDPGNGFGLHCVNVSGHLTTGGLSTAQVEAHFDEKMGDMKEYDAFMDYSVTLYTSGVEQYAAAFDADSVPYYTTTFQASDDASAQTYTSLIVQVPHTQMILELTSKKGLSASRSQKPVHLVHERRLSSNAIANIDAIADAEEESGATLSPISVNRAVSAVTMAKLDDFYVKGMGAKKVSDDSANGVSRKCYLWTGATVDVCFTSRPDSATKGSFKVEDFENMLNTVHKNIIVGHPYCQVDKWEDNHYAIDSFSASTSSIISYINANNVPHICESGGGGSGMSGLHYIFDPTGWGIQADLSFSSQPNDCTSSQVFDSFRRLQGSYNPACEPGTCGSADLVV